MSLSERLRERRKKLGLTNGQVATYVGISRTHVSDLENGKSNPSIDLLIRLARYYKTTVDYLLELTENPVIPGANGDVPTVYSHRDATAIINDLPDDYRSIVAALAVALRDLDRTSQERALGQFILGLLGNIEDRLGKDAARELTAAIELFTTTGDDSALRVWFGRYFRPGNFGPNQE